MLDLTGSIVLCIDYNEIIIGAIMRLQTTILPPFSMSRYFVNI